jgi:hypothetical protein
VASAAGVFQTVDRVHGALTPAAQTVFGRLPDGFSQYSPEVLTARSSVYWPGAGIAGLGTLLCTAGAVIPPPFDTPFNLVACHFPKYPLSVQADGQTPDATEASPAPEGGAGSPVGIGAANADAHADQIKGVSTNSSIAGFDTPQGTGAVMHIGSIDTHTTQNFDPLHPSILIVHAEARLAGINILGGLVRIDSIFATSTVTTDGDKINTRQDELQIGGVTAGGVAATIGSNGISLNGSGKGNPVIDTLNSTIHSALSAAGVSIRLIGVMKPPSLLENPRLCTAGEVDGLQVQAHLNVNIPPNLPPQIEQLIGGYSDTYFANIVLAGACTDATSSGVTNAVVAPPVSGTGTSTGAGTSTVGSNTSFGSSAPSSTGNAGTVGNAAPSFSASPALPSTNRTGLGSGARSVSRFLEAELSSHLVTHGLTLLYLIFSLVFLALCLVLRPLVPARLPSGR